MARVEPFEHRVAKAFQLGTMGGTRRPDPIRARVDSANPTIIGVAGEAAVTPTFHDFRYGTWMDGGTHNLPLAGASVLAGDLLIVALASTHISSGACGGPGASHAVAGAALKRTQQTSGGSCRTARASLWTMAATPELIADGIDYTVTAIDGTLGGGILAVVIRGGTDVANLIGNGPGVNNPLVGPLDGANYTLVSTSQRDTGANAMPGVEDEFGNPRTLLFEAGTGNGKFRLYRTFSTPDQQVDGTGMSTIYKLEVM